ncbi:PREDICTED: upstream activation factor subunit UAF30-like [Camelina sativa]|uniref:Upstream activation factor subunit UAF30-like n=1 Tax=Camelina sativa TaxID=90675 RepID=A0ABM0YEG1_CAMSA|nr:PREDICTED: upstream activation factor subunit UAF30-like [Camelina sativa]
MAAISRVFGGFRTLMAKAATAEAVTVAGAAGKEGKGVFKVFTVSQPLASFAGESQLTRGTAVKKVWEYVKLHNLQNPANKREIHCDAKLKTIFDGKDKVGITEVMKLLSPHFPKSV